MPGIGSAISKRWASGMAAAVALPLLISLAGATSVEVEQATETAPNPAPVIIAEEAILASHVIVEQPAIQVVPSTRPATPAFRIMQMEVTAYCACRKCCGPKAKGITASGKHVSYNDGEFVAADTKLLPFGQKLVIPGYASNQPVEVIDRGGAIKGNRLDVFFASHEQALEWGRRRTPVIVIETQ